MINKNVLMTGATGFLGSNLLKSLLDSGWQVAILKRKTSNLFRIADIMHKIEMYNIEEGDFSTCLKTAKPEMIIHCATDYGRKAVDPLQIVEANLILPLKLLELSTRHGVRCFVNTDTLLNKRVSNYSLSKRQFVDWLQLYSKELTCVNMVLEHFYGPFDDETKFVSFIIEKFISNAPFIELTPGEQKRDFIFISDVVEAFKLILGAAGSLQPGFYNYEVGTGEQIRIKDLVEKIRNIVGNATTEARFGALAYRDNEVMEPFVNNSAIKEMGWIPRYPLAEGLRLTIEAEKQRAG